MTKIRKIIPIIFRIIFWIILAGILTYLLWWRYRLGVGRYFDSDEFSYLFWGYQFHLGLKPYSDFFYFLPPFFLYPISWIFDVFGRDVSAINAARQLMFAVFIFAMAPVFLMIRMFRGAKAAILTVIIASVLPLPYDKMIEIRPDTLAYGFALWGIYFFFRGYKGNYLFSLLSGILSGISLMVIPKTLPVMIPVFTVYFFRFILTQKGEFRRTIREILLFAAGLLIPAVLGLAIVFWSGGWPGALYFMTRFASESTAILGREYYIQSYQFFGSYIDAYFGATGITVPWAFNLTVYLLSYAFAVFRFMGSFRFRDPRKCIMEFTLSGIFIVNLYMHVKVYPLKHTQYLIPLVPLASYYLTDLLLFLAGRLQAAVGFFRLRIPKTVFENSAVLALAVFSAFVGFRMNSLKIWWGNRSTYAYVTKLLKDIPKDASVYDLSGGSVFFRTGYYFCCLPYGQYEKALRFPYPEISKDMEKRKTDYVHAGGYKWGALGGIPSKHASYVKENFTDFDSDQTVFRRKPVVK